MLEKTKKCFRHRRVATSTQPLERVEQEELSDAGASTNVTHSSAVAPHTPRQSTHREEGELGQQCTTVPVVESNVPADRVERSLSEICPSDALPSPSAILILCLDPGQYDDPLKGWLKAVDLEMATAVNYWALSYVWGNPAPYG